MKIFNAKYQKYNSYILKGLVFLSSVVTSCATLSRIWILFAYWIHAVYVTFLLVN